ncbi:PiggyBac transposable element-derived protein 4 [Plakobranchus ocellatus]|uniref:PiggyBac transposable element-derived protein 4 n=1 Tax=Plakobranchus ocellatus TaxID=259542 RepID=A0AAV4CPA5_9GAST|nr:PiggyBac transposable element-derived protein 4 [Plakobranchus ocellatus]
MDASTSGVRPKRMATNAVYKMLAEMSDEEFGILSDDDSLFDESQNRSSNESGSSSSDAETEVCKKGALPSTNGKKFPDRSKSSSKVRSTSKVVRPANDDLLDLDLDEDGRSVQSNGDAQEPEWREIEEATTDLSFRFVRHGRTGISPDARNLESALDFFLLLFNETIIDGLLKNINDYAAEICKKNNPPTRYSIFARFYPVTTEELFRFLAILFAMGQDQRSTIKCYWSNAPHRYTPWYHQMMPRKRFEAIYHTFLHASGTNAENQEKIEPFLESLVASFQAAYYPSKELSIDEMVIGFHGRWKNKQLYASKPSKYHIKTFGLCESSTGYVYNIFTYYGASTAYHPDLDKDCSQAIKIFEKLLRPLDKGHHIFADWYYTSMPLLQYLEGRSFYYTGTIDPRRKYFPPTLKTLTLEHMGMKWFLHKSNNQLVVAFRDKKAKKNCAVVTNAGKVGTTEIRTRRGTYVKKPSCIHHYNQCINGCDRADQLVQYYGMHKRKSYKWWKKIFHWLLELTVINACILFDKGRVRDDKYQKTTLLNFKDLLIQQLTDRAADLEPVAKRQPPQPVATVERMAPQSHFIISVKEDRNCRVCSRPEKRKRTTTVCATCPGRPYLCKKNCFKLWHTKLNIEV